MAESHSLEELGKRMQIVADGTYENIGRTLRKVALQMDQVLVLATPVDTGRARANWLVTVGAPAEGEGAFTPGAPEREGGTSFINGGKAWQAAIEQGAAIIDQYKLEMGSIFITNNVPYIGALDRGHSRQAPNGMTERAIQAGEALLGREQILPR